MSASVHPGWSQPFAESFTDVASALSLVGMERKVIKIRSHLSGMQMREFSVR